MDSTLNLYHRWAYLDEIAQQINAPTTLKLSTRAIKIIRTLTLLDGVSFAILNSFCHLNHPAQVDTHKKLNWIISLKNILQAWHEIFHVFLQQETIAPDLRDKITSTKPISFKLNSAFNQAPFSAEKKQIQKMLLQWSKKHAECFFKHKNATDDWRHLQAHLIDPKFIHAITADQNIDPVKQKYAHIEPFFRGIHQMLEIAMHVVVDDSQQLQQAIKQLKTSANNMLDATQYETVLTLRDNMQHLQHWWEIAAKNIMLLNKMDTGSYAEYRQALLGTSGGDSKQLRQLKVIMTHLHIILPQKLSEPAVQKDALYRESNDPLLNQLLSAIRETQAASADFWMRHFTLTANTIGMIRGSQGLPVEKLLSFAVSPLLSKDSLLQTVGNVGYHYAQSPEAVVVQVEPQREKIIGNTIFSHVKNQFSIVREYRTAAAQLEPLLDALELRPLEPNDTQTSPYAAWFHPDVHNEGLRFEMHSFGTPLILLQESIAKTTQRITEKQNHYWQTFFSERMQQLKTILFKLFEINHDQGFAVTVDANITILLDRLISALPRDEKTVVLTSDQEFLSIQRSLAAAVNEKQFELEKVSLQADALDLAKPFCEAINRLGKKLKLVIFSQVMSNSQISFTEDELEAIIDAAPVDVPVIIDTAQGAFNVPISWGKLLKKRHNVYVLGSAIKHGRSTSGLGFLIHPEQGSLLRHPKQSGWCAYMSGLQMGKTTDAEGKLLYDDALQWLGATPGNFFTLDIFINTWDAILRAGETLQSMHQYVRTLHDKFFQHVPHKIVDHTRRSHRPAFSSNAMVLQLSLEQSKELIQRAAQKNIYFDCRNQGVRVGFGVQHGKTDVEKLCEIL